MRKQFPVLHSSHRDGDAEYIPWEILEPHEAQIYANHGQSLEQLASRGGLSWREIYAVITDKEFDYRSKRVTDYYRRAVLDAVEKFNQRNQTNRESDRCSNCLWFDGEEGDGTQFCDEKQREVSENGYCPMHKRRIGENESRG